MWSMSTSAFVLAFLADPMALKIVGTAIAVIMPMIAITTSNSTRVKAGRGWPEGNARLREGEAHVGNVLLRIVGCMCVLMTNR